MGKFLEEPKQGGLHGASYCLVSVGHNICLISWLPFVLRASDERGCDRSQHHALVGDHVDNAGHTIVVKTSDGVDETYNLGRDSAIDAKDGFLGAAHFTGKEGDHVIVYHTEAGGRKVVHLLERL